MWPDINIDPLTPKSQIVSQIRQKINDLGYQVVDEDIDRPWGGYWRFDEQHSQDFKKQFFPNVDIPDWAKDLPFSPKFLFTAPNTRLSWQYHDRRGEIWVILKGTARVYISSTNQQPYHPKSFHEDDIIYLPQGIRHRMSAPHEWNIWGEMWIHTDPTHPSEESDNHRLQDDFGRT